ncbi:MAG: hypothetical protein OEV23_07925 [Gallionella sp.]|nr:hypothetical protein [Gallionella sp.]
MANFLAWLGSDPANHPVLGNKLPLGFYFGKPPPCKTQARLLKKRINLALSIYAAFYCCGYTMRAFGNPLSDMSAFLRIFKKQTT